MRKIPHFWERYELTSEVAWDLPLEQAAIHCCRQVESFDHWFLRLRWAAGLHNLIDDDKLAGDEEASDREEDAGVGEAGGGNCEMLIEYKTSFSELKQSILRNSVTMPVVERRKDAGVNLFSLSLPTWA